MQFKASNFSQPRPRPSNGSEAFLGDFEFGSFHTFAEHKKFRWFEAIQEPEHAQVKRLAVSKVAEFLFVFLCLVWDRLDAVRRMLFSDLRHALKDLKAGCRWASMCLHGSSMVYIV